MKLRVNVQSCVLRRQKTTADKLFYTIVCLLYDWKAMLLAQFGHSFLPL